MTAMITPHPTEVKCPRRGCGVPEGHQCVPAIFEVNVTITEDGHRQDFHPERYELAECMANHPSNYQPTDNYEETKAFAEFIKLTSEDMAEYDEA